MNKPQSYYNRQLFPIATSSSSTPASASASASSQKRINTMIYYLFPRSGVQINQQLYCVCSSNMSILSSSYQTQNPIISNSLCKYIHEINTIMKTNPLWKTHPRYPYMHLDKISTIKHVSFIFFELIELHNLMRLNLFKYSVIHTIHFGNCANSSMKMCEYIRSKTNTNNHTIDQHECVYPINYSIGALDCYYKDKKNSMDFVFHDASGENEYQNAVELLKQLCIGLCAQKYKGCCIVKYGDSFTTLSLDVITFLSHFYEKTYFIKPSVCDLSSSDKYIVCKYFVYNGLSERMYQSIRSLFLNITQKNSNMHVERIFNHVIPVFFSSRLEEINSIFGQSRLEYIQSQLTHAHKLKSDKQLQENNMRKQCVEWCMKYNIPFSS